jgi:twitching motility protein PilI
MFERTTLREFQEDLSRRLALAATSRNENTSVLAIESGAGRWLLTLADISEVLPLPRLTSAPLSKSWYVGLANVRGSLYSVVDFGAFCGEAPVRISPANRLLLCSPRYAVNAGLLVDRVVGLRDGRELNTVKEHGPARAWQKSVKQDGEGRLCRELDIAALVKSAEFLNIGM